MDDMNIIFSIIFGIVEGITEWLPVSSTGHLILFQSFMQFNNVSEGFWDVFEVVIQLGAILAVVLLYFKKIWPFKLEKKSENNKLKINKDIINLWIKIIISCFPVVLIAVFKIDELAEKYFYNPASIAVMLIIVGIAFILIERKNKDKKKFRVNSIKDLTYKDAVIIGMFQVIAAIFPGTSRSGATIIGALLIGVSRVVSAEYTFYLAIPAMFGASLLKLVKYGFGFTGTEIVILLVGTIVAFLVSIFVIRFLMTYIKKHNFEVFGWYRIALGIIVLSLILFNVI
ncbi:MAG: undecaprenyl-diphosphate phosphatase [Clostridia bacterium]|nr:undecaprenyl-diphosphate phosphatase [Clostridia bacterium]